MYIEKLIIFYDIMRALTLIVRLSIELNFLVLYKIELKEDADYKEDDSQITFIKNGAVMNQSVFYGPVRID